MARLSGYRRCAVAFTHPICLREIRDFSRRTAESRNGCPRNGPMFSRDGQARRTESLLSVPPASGPRDEAIGMSGRFGGSRSLDERRRRRIAAESEEPAAVAVAAAPAPLKRAAPEKVEGRRRGPSHFPLRRAISARAWKLAAVGVLGLAVAAGILAGGWVVHLAPTRFGPGMGELFDLKKAVLPRCYATVLTFLSGELALVLWWLRSQSLRDFSGRYRGWVLCAVLALGAAVAVQINATDAWSRSVCWLWPRAFWKKSELSWIVPAVLVALPALRFLDREMRDCRASRALLWLSMLLASGLTGLILARPLPLLAGQSRLIECASAMSAALSFFLSLLFHARHAIYVTVEPSNERASLLLTVLRQLRRSAVFARARKGDATPTKMSQSRRKRKARPPESTRERESARESTGASAPMRRSA
jgi:hypothetical protein